MTMDIVDKLVLANKVLVKEKVLDGLGHISVRNPENRDTFLIAGAVAPVNVKREDIMEVDLEGRVIGAASVKPVGERFLHAAIYQVRDDVNSVFHGHHPLAVVFSLIDVELVPVCHLGAFLCDGVPVFKQYREQGGMLIDSLEEGFKVAKVLGDKRALLLWGHGYVVVAETLERAIVEAIYLVQNAYIQLSLMLLQKKVPSIPAGEAKTVMEKALFAEGVISRILEHWLSGL